MSLSGWLDADFAAYFLFVFVAAFTPGSSNVRLASAASKFGWRRVVPHVYGMTAGLMALAWVFWFALEAAYRQFSWLDVCMKWLSIAYLLWRAWDMVQERVGREVLAQKSPKTWRQAFKGVWTSPNDWSYVVALISAFMPQTSSWWHVTWMVLVLPVALLPGRAAWLLFGGTFQRFLSSAENLRLFHIFLAVMLVLTLIPTLNN